MEQACHNERNQTHIQKGCRKTANGEIVGGDLTGLAQDLPEAGQHIGAVGHTDSRHQKSNTHKGKEQLQKTAFGQAFDLFHKNLLRCKMDNPSFTGN